MIHESCVGIESGTVSFQPSGLQNQGVGRVVTSADKGVKRPCISLDDFLGDPLCVPCLIKMDIEGAEWLALQGAQRTLGQRKAPLAILLEVHPEEIGDLGGTVQGVRGLLERIGLEVHALTPNGLESLDSGKTYRFWWAESN